MFTYNRIRIKARMKSSALCQPFRRAALFVQTIPSRFQEPVLEGLSLSKCVPYIAEGKIPLHMVKRIHTSTAFETREDFLAAISRYASNRVWQKNSNRCVKIALYLWDHGKINQPRLEGKSANIVINGEVWFIGSEIISDDMLADRIVNLNRL